MTNFQFLQKTVRAYMDAHRVLTGLACRAGLRTVRGKWLLRQAKRAVVQSLNLTSALASFQDEDK